MSTWYLDLRLMAKYFDPPHVYQHTPSPPLWYAMHAALATIEEEGLRNRWDRHQRANERLIAGLTRLGFEPLVTKPEDRIWHLTTVTPPKGVDEAQLRQRLFDKYNIEVAGGLGQLAGKILRIGTMGPLATDESVDFLLEAMSASLWHPYAIRFRCSTGPLRTTVVERRHHHDSGGCDRQCGEFRIDRWRGSGRRNPPGGWPRNHAGVERDPPAYRPLRAGKRRRDRGWKAAGEIHFPRGRSGVSGWQARRAASARIVLSHLYAACR